MQNIFGQILAPYRNRFSSQQKPVLQLQTVQFTKICFAIQIRIIFSERQRNTNYSLKCT